MCENPSLTLILSFKSDQDKATKDHQIRNLNDEIAHQDELINKLNKEKKSQGESVQKTSEDLQVRIHSYCFRTIDTLELRY
jgi:uncharacterized coiled-coil protein SlyX